MFRTEVVEKIETHLFLITFFFKSWHLRDMWKNMVQSNRPTMTIWRMRIAFWITKATNTHSQYVTITAFPLQQWLHERASVLRLRTLRVLCCHLMKQNLSTYTAIQIAFSTKPHECTPCKATSINYTDPYTILIL